MTSEAGVGLPDIEGTAGGPVADETAAGDATEALRVAMVVARTAGVEVRSVAELSELAAIEDLYNGIWRADTTPPVTTGLLRALSKAGNYVAGAFAGRDLVGACVGFFATPSEAALHSHIAGVLAGRRLRNVGLALKLHQRAWALEHGLSMIEWTFDPLVARNAHFNIVKLAADPAEYLPNFYGDMSDAINGNDDSDRMLVHWRLDARATADACAGRPRIWDTVADPAGGVGVALGVSGDERPVAGRPSDEISLVAVPVDIEAMRSSVPSLAREWRIAVRETLVELLGEGGQIIGFDRSRGYVVRRHPL